MQPRKITVHTSASTFGQFVTVADITKMHRKKKYRTIGYHRVIYLDATVHQGRQLNEQGAHVHGHNRDNVGICLIGGLDKNGKPAFTYSEEMMEVLFKEIMWLCETYDIPFENVCGHRDYSPDLNGDGKITSNEFMKECPCFDVRSWFSKMLSEHGINRE